MGLLIGMTNQSIDASVFFYTMMPFPSKCRHHAGLAARKAHHILVAYDDVAPMFEHRVEMSHLCLISGNILLCGKTAEEIVQDKTEKCIIRHKLKYKSN